KPGDTGRDKQLGAILAGALARAGDQEAIAEARARFARYLDDPASVSPSSIEFVLGTAGRYADAATYEAIFKRAIATTSFEERNRLGRALSSAQDPALAERTMQLALSPQVPPNIALRLVPDVGREHTEQA